jgi:hypothetical protein
MTSEHVVVDLWIQVKVFGLLFRCSHAVVLGSVVSGDW